MKLADKIVLITGGTGSFGNTVLEKLLTMEVAEVRVFSRDEKKQDEMRHKYNDERIKFYIGDVRDYQSITNAIHEVDYIFHAAALKQVPSCEFFPMEAVKTNVIGTDNVLTAAINYGVKKVVCLSTDKAAYPVNAMGISKAMMEKVFVAKSRTVSYDKTVICGTRYGNVMCSRGSAIPLFIEQIRNNEAITVTEPLMTRFIMSLDEAVELVLYAFENGKEGDILIQKAPSCYIGDLAQAVGELFDNEKGIRIIGTRHGEKLHEVLMTKEEAAKAVDEGNFFRIPSDNRSLNYGNLESGSHAISKAVEFASNTTEILGVEAIKARLMKLEYIRNCLGGAVER